MFSIKEPNHYRVGEKPMGSFHEYMNEYKKQLIKGDIIEAYQGLMAYFGDLRSYFKNKYPDYVVSGSIYYGYMDMTYFPIIPESLKRRNLKIALVFVHGTFRFEVWLAAKNKTIQTKYLELLNNSDWSKYHISETTKGVDSILDSIIIDDPDFNDLDALTKQIEIRTLEFIKDVEGFLSKQKELP